MSGGENVTGWSLANDPLLPPGVYRAPVPSALLGGNSRQLYVNGRRAPRTSRAASGVVPGLALEGGTSADCPSGACAYTAATADPLSWANAADVEFVWAGVASGWSESRCAVASVAAAGPQPPQPNCTVDPSNEPDCGFFESTEEQCINNRTAAHPNGCCWHEGGLAPSTHWCVAPAFAGNVTPTAATRIVIKQPCLWNLVNRPDQPYGGSPPTAVENVRAHLDSPGSFYLDRARGEILDLPLPGEDITTADAVVAVEETLLALRGASRQSFADIAFSFATWLRPGEAEGIVDQQGTASSTCAYGVPTLSAHGCGLDDVFTMTPGNVALVGARDVDFESCTFTHLGAFGASASGGSQRVAWRGCAFADTSGGAVMLGDTASFNDTDVANWDRDLSVSDSTMQGAVEFTGATTVFIAYVQNATIEHCYLYNASYSGMTVGWGWGRTASRHGGNNIVGNRVLGVQTQRCCDGGGLYTLGPQPGSQLNANYVAWAWAQPSGSGNGIYHDNGSGGFTDTDNVIDGPWSLYLFQDDPDGPYGPTPQYCPSSDWNAPTDCGMAFENNWMRTSAGGTNNHQNTSYANNTKVDPASPLPPAAQAIADASGPRAAWRQRR